MGRKAFVRTIALAAVGASLMGMACATKNENLTPEGQARLEQAEKRAQRYEHVTNPAFDDRDFVNE